MNQCLHYNRPCSGSSMLCKECILYLQQHSQRREQIASSSSLAEISDAPESSLSVEGDTEPGIPILSSETVPMDVYASNDEFSPRYEVEDEDPPASVIVDASDRSLERLNDAARLIAEAESDFPQNGRGPRASRLAPLRDISADIRRESTPMPNASFTTQPVAHKVVGRKALDEHLPDLWPWLHTAEVDESKDEWIDQVDPLQSRSFPSSAESMKIEQEDIHRILGDRISVVWEKVKHDPQKCLRIVFICLSILAALALVIDTVMVAILQQRTPTVQTSQLPMMTFSSRFAKTGDHITIHLNNFPALTTVVLSHDIQESVSLEKQSGEIKLNAQGSKSVVMLIDNSWEVGQHTVVAEDVQTRYTASGMLQINGGPMPPSHLEVSTADLDLGSQYVGANSFQMLSLKNAGGGVINWSASSNNSWLMFSPKNGMFSDHQDIQVAADRTNLTPGVYQGKITIISNVSQPQDISVQMVVLALPKNAGAVMSVTPAIMTYNVGDGQADPSNQSLMIMNPGTKALHWSISDSAPMSQADENSYVNTSGMTNRWLSTGTTSGTVAPGSTAEVIVKVNSQHLLPGTYNSALKFAVATGYTAINSPQLVNVTLIVQPRCGILLSTGSLSFIAIAGQATTSNQVLSLMGSASCSDVVDWHTTTSVHWLTMTPTQGQIKGAEQSITTVAVNPANLKPGTYDGTITLALAQSTQTVNIQLIVQSPPTPSAPIIGVSPLTLNFSQTKGQADPAAQSVTLTNTGQSALIWNAVPNPMLLWLGVAQSQGSIAPGQTDSLVVSVSANGLTPGSYVGQVVLSGVDASGNPASGSPQMVNVTFTVLAPCTLALPSTSSLAFSSVEGFADPAPQSIMITASGNCNWPVTWQTSSDPADNWFNLSSGGGTFTTSGQSATLTVAPSNAGLLTGDYHATIRISATDSTGVAVEGSPQSLAIDFNVQAPCALQVNSAGLSFSVTQGQSSNVQNIPLSSTGNCSLPLSWTAQVNSGWLNLSSASGSDNGSGSSIGVNVDVSGLNIGTYSGIVSFSAVGSGGANVVGNPQISVTLNVTGSIVNVAAASCQNTSCVAPSSLSGASVSLSDSNGTIVASGTTDTNGNVSLSNVPIGSYTLLVNGADVSGALYIGSSTVVVVGGAMNVSINAVPTAPDTGGNVDPSA